MTPSGEKVTTWGILKRYKKVFATLGYPDKFHGMVKLSPEEQHYFAKDYPDAFVPVKGVWGKRGATSVYLKAAKKAVVKRAVRKKA